jgi:hypothetical protein
VLCSQRQQEVRGASNLRQRFEQPLVVLQWLVGLVLLITSANVANLLLLAAFTAGFVPAWRASRIDPVRALVPRAPRMSGIGP